MTRGKGTRERRELPVNGLTQAATAALRVKHVVQAAVGVWGWMIFKSLDATVRIFHTACLCARVCQTIMCVCVRACVGVWRWEGGDKETERDQSGDEMRGTQCSKSRWADLNFFCLRVLQRSSPASSAVARGGRGAKRRDCTLHSL